MILVTQTRNGEKLDSREKPLSKALSLLINCELAFGGLITELTDTKVSVQTQVFDCLDVSTFTGTVDEMKSLIKASVYAAAITPQMYEGQGLEWTARNAMEMTRGSPLLISLATGMFAGEGIANMVRVALISDGMVERVPDLLKIKSTSLAAMLELQIEEGINYDELMELAAC